MQKLNTAFSTDLITLAAEVIVGKSYGSGIYIYRENQIFFCTARHVLYNNINPKGTPNFKLKQNQIEIKSYPKDTTYENFEKIHVNLKALEDSNQLSVHQINDICTFKIANLNAAKLKLVQGVKKLSDTLNLNVASSQMVKSTKDIEPGEELYIIGYPKALQFLNRQQPFYNYNLPLVRKGITSCMNDHQTFIIDCAVFGGNSGGPVFVVENTISNNNGKMQIKNNRYLIGIAIQYVPLLNMSAQKLNPRIRTFNHAENSGYGVCVSFDELTKEIDKIIDMHVV